MLLAGGLVVGGGEYAKNEGKIQLCEKTPVDPYADLTKYSEAIYAMAVSDNMCTAQCPCKTTANKDAWSKEKVSPAILAGFNRIHYSDMTVDQKTALYGSPTTDAEGNPQETSKLWAGLVSDPKYEGPFPLLFVADADGFDDYMKCFEKVLKPLFESSGADPEQTEFLSTGLPFFSELENKLDCSGFCYKPLFGISRPVKSGPVEMECAQGIVNTLDALVGPAAVCILTGVILCCAFCGSVPLCFGFDKDELDGP